MFTSINNYLKKKQLIKAITQESWSLVDETEALRQDQLKKFAEFSELKLRKMPEESDKEKKTGLFSQELDESMRILDIATEKMTSVNARLQYLVANQDEYEKWTFEAIEAYYKAAPEISASNL